MEYQNRFKKVFASAIQEEENSYIVEELFSRDICTMMNLSEMELQREFSGIGPKRAAQIYSVLTLLQMNIPPTTKKTAIKNPEDGAEYLMREMRYLQQEHFVVLYLNTKQEVIHKQSVFIGSLNQAIVHPREIYREAVKLGAFATIICHNHPSGDPSPSNEDIKATKRLLECGKVMGIEVLDHIIIGDNRYLSMKQEGYI